VLGLSELSHLVLCGWDASGTDDMLLISMRSACTLSNCSGGSDTTNNGGLFAVNALSVLTVTGSQISSCQVGGSGGAFTVAVSFLLISGTTVRLRSVAAVHSATRKSGLSSPHWQQMSKNCT